MQGKSMSACWHSSMQCWLGLGCPLRVLLTPIACLGASPSWGTPWLCPSERAGGSCCFQVCNAVTSPCHPVWPWDISNIPGKVPVACASFFLGEAAGRGTAGSGTSGL